MRWIFFAVFFGGGINAAFMLGFQPSFPTKNNGATVIINDCINNGCAPISGTLIRNWNSDYKIYISKNRFFTMKGKDLVEHNENIWVFSEAYIWEFSTNNSLHL